MLQGHPDMNKTPGVDMTVGSLGQGICAGMGMALAAQLRKNDYHVWVVVGDGEMQEGSVWEAAMAGAKWKLDNMTVIIDNNRLQNDIYINDVMPMEPVADKWRAFGWHVGKSTATVWPRSWRRWMRRARKGNPAAIVANTVKGKGVSFMENMPEWHGKAPSAARGRTGAGEIGRCAVKSTLPSHPARDPALFRNGELFAKAEGEATRFAYAEALLELGESNPCVVVLNADVSKSINTNNVRGTYPEREFNFGISEQNMMAAAAGMATTGLIPFATTYAVFASMRALDQVRNSIHYPHLNVKIGASHSGITPARTA